MTRNPGQKHGVTLNSGARRPNSGGTSQGLLIGNGRPGQLPLDEDEADEDEFDQASEPAEYVTSNVTSSVGRGQGTRLVSESEDQLSRGITKKSTRIIRPKGNKLIRFPQQAFSSPVKQLRTALAQGRDMSRSSPTPVPKGRAHTNAPPRYKQREWDRTWTEDEYLWKSQRRHAKGTVPVYHDELYKIAERLLISRMVGDDGIICGRTLSPWMDSQRSRFANLMCTCWEAAIMLLPQEEARSTVQDLPDPLLDAAGDFRVHCIRKVRAAVQTAYNLPFPQNRDFTVSELLADFAFLSENPSKRKVQRFCHTAIAAALARVFYTEGKWGLPMKIGSSEYFEDISGNTIAFIGASMAHAISEFSDDGSRKTVGFLGHHIEQNYNAIRAKWQQISPGRRAVIWSILQKKMKPFVSSTDQDGSTLEIEEDDNDDNIEDILEGCTEQERKEYIRIMEQHRGTKRKRDNLDTGYKSPQSQSSMRSTPSPTYLGNPCWIRTVNGTVLEFVMELVSSLEDFHAVCGVRDNRLAWYLPATGWTAISSKTWIDFKRAVQALLPGEACVKVIVLEPEEYEDEDFDWDTCLVNCTGAAL